MAPEPTNEAEIAEEPAAAGRVAELRSKAEGLTTQGKKLVDESRQTLPPVDIGFSAFERDSHIGGFVLAGAIAFRLFVYVLPLYLLALVIAGAVFAFNPDQPKDLADSAGMSSYLSSTIGDAANTSHKSLWLLIPLTLYAVFSAGMSVYKVIATAHARAWSLPTTPKSKPHYVALGIFGASLLVLMVSRILSVVRHGVLIPPSMAMGVVAYSGFWLLVSHKLPRAEGTTWWSLLPGALLVGIGTQALYLFNVLYLNHKIQSASQAYGALGVAATALAWLYLLGRLMVAAPVLNATMWHREHPESTPVPTAESPADADPADPNAAGT